MSDKDDKVMVDEYLDAAGRKRTFTVGVLTPPGDWIEAVEQRAGGEPGLRFAIPVRADEPACVPWGAIRDKVRARLCQRDLVRDEHGELHDLNRLIRAQITSGPGEELPVLLVDDLTVGWLELGRMLAMYEGYGLRIEIRECGEE
jgi:hypothetical protein